MLPWQVKAYSVLDEISEMQMQYQNGIIMEARAHDSAGVSVGHEMEGKDSCLDTHDMPSADANRLKCILFYLGEGESSYLQVVMSSPIFHNLVRHHARNYCRDKLLRNFNLFFFHQVILDPPSRQ